MSDEWYYMYCIVFHQGLLNNKYVEQSIHLWLLWSWKCGRRRGNWSIVLPIPSTEALTGACRAGLLFSAASLALLLQLLVHLLSESRVGPAFLRLFWKG